jgi:hypothetical protein
MIDAPADTRPFARFEWMLASRYLRTRRREGFVSVIAGFSFLGIMLGVATLIIVLSVMNGFRKELLDKIVGVNGHIFLTPIERPLDDYAEVATKLMAIKGVTLAIPMVEGQALASSQYGNSGVLVRGMRESDIQKIPFIAKNIKQGTLEGFDANGVAIGIRLAEALSIRAGDQITIISPRGAATPFGTAPRIKAYPVVAVFEIGMSEFDGTFAFMPLGEAQAYFNRDDDVNVIEVFIENADRTQTGKGRHRGQCPASARADRLAAAQPHLLLGAGGGAQRDVPDPDADRAGCGPQHRLRPDHAGEGQEFGYRHPAHHGRDQWLGAARVPDHGGFDRRGWHHRRLRPRASGLRQHPGNPELRLAHQRNPALGSNRPLPHRDSRRDQSDRSRSRRRHGAGPVAAGHAVSGLARCPARSGRSAEIRVRRA